MKGKKKLLTMLLATIALVVTGVVFGVGDTIRNIAYAQASEIPGYSMEFEGGKDGKNLIFSVEKVYFAKDNANRSKNLKYSGDYKFKPIATSEGVKYFGDFGLYTDINGSYSNKAVVKDGKFTKLDDTININAKDADGADVAIKQGVMVTFGGYYHTSESDSSNVKTNVIEWTDANKDNIVDMAELTGWIDIDGDDQIDEGELPGWTDANEDNKVNVNELTGWTDKGAIRWDDKNNDYKIALDELSGWGSETLEGLPGWTDAGSKDNKVDITELNANWVRENVIEWTDDGDNVVEDGELSGWTGTLNNLPGWTPALKWVDTNDDNIVDATELTGWTDANSNKKIDEGELAGWSDTNGDGKVDLDELAGWKDTNADGKIDTNDTTVNNNELMGWKDMDSDGTKDYYCDGAYYSDGKYYLNVGAQMQYVSVQVKKDGTVLTDIPSSRTYNNQYQDFTWFIDGTKENEGHYEISISYMIDGKALKADFDFYLLLESSYSDTVEVNDNQYTPKPTFTNARAKSTSTATNRQYYFNHGNNYNYPTLTYDYTRYKVSYTHISGDLHKNVDVIYDDATRQIVVTTTIYDEGTSKYYGVDDFAKPEDEDEKDNKILSLMFADNGQYTFDVKYIYTKDSTNLIIDKQDLAFGNMSLDIYGYQLKYSKAGFVSADMVDLKIVQNGTMFILINGFTNAAKERDGDSLGIHYELIAGTDKTGIVKVGESEAGSISNFETSLPELPEEKGYSKTDRGLWLTLNDEYDLDNSKYWHSTSRITDVSTGGEKLTKVTTFTTPGYYLVKVSYKYKLDSAAAIANHTDTQYFAFQITSATPQLELYKTEENNSKGDKTNFYAREFTNQNVFATWADRGVFESQIKGKLYYTTNKAYPKENVYLSVINGGASTNIRHREYTKETIITDSDAYMLVLEVEKSATRTYSYFTIDKDSISGLEVYQVTTSILDNKAIYTIGRDAQMKYIKHTDKGTINTNFTIGWNDKASRAQISATYVYTPFVKTDNEITTPTETTGDITYTYITNRYVAGTSSKAISIDRPSTLSGALLSDNVLTNQGIYEFTLTDQAGNILRYIMVIDRTDAIVSAKYGDYITWNDINKDDMVSVDELIGWGSKTLEGLPGWEHSDNDDTVNIEELTGWSDTDGDSKIDSYMLSAINYNSGEKVAAPVHTEWGTHKAIDLSSITESSNSVIYNMLTKNDAGIATYYENYYQVSGNNWNNILNLFMTVSDTQLYAVQHEYVELKEASEEDYYRITKYGEKQTRYYGGIASGWQADSVADRLFTNYANSKLTILVDTTSARRYTVSVVGANKVDNSTNINFNVVITPDKALGTIYSSSANNTTEFNNEVYPADRASNAKVDGTQLTNGELGDTLTIDLCDTAQASDDGKFVFEWIKPNTEDNFEVISVVYHYYKLMSIDELDMITNKMEESYYPYKYVTTNEILTKNGDTIKVKDYSEAIRGGNTIYRSNPINLGYETYYEGETLVSRSVTQTGLYIITRTLRTGNNADSDENFSYAFFVDRNSIVGYSLSNVSEKIVGQFIHASMPSSTITWTDRNNNDIVDEAEVTGWVGALSILPGWEKSDATDTTIDIGELSGWFDKNGDGKVDTYGSEVHYDNFTKQGLSKKTLIIDPSAPSNNIQYKVYVETNKMPTSIKVPTGKYVTGKYTETSSQIIATSYNTLKLQLSIYFKDTYKILPQSVKNNGESTIKLMDCREYKADEYINLDFETNDEGMKGLLAEYMNARIHSNDNALSLPGEYIFVINDLVGIKHDEHNSITDYNTFVFGIKLTKQDPNIDVFTYAKNKDKNITSTYTYATGKELYTNQEYVDFELNLEDLSSYNAQVDQRNFSIYRSNIDGSNNGPWFEMKNGVVNSNLPQNNDSIINRSNPDKWIIKLPTGIETDEFGQIKNYREYIYTINVQYVLNNTASQYYTYKYANKNETTGDLSLVSTDFYKSVYTVYVDRTPDNENLNTILSNQNAYFEGYHKWLSGASAEEDININANFAYRNINSIGDYYGFTNNLYYQFVNNSQYDNASQAMYAITIDDKTEFKDDDLYAVYYRELDFDSGLDAKQRMGLLPICDRYFGNSTGFYTFSEALTEYSMNRFLGSKKDTYKDIILGSADGKYYEIIEKDKAGNLTQYVIYFMPSTPKNPSLTVKGKLIGNDEQTDESMAFTPKLTTDNQKAFISIEEIVVNELASSGKQYYGNINIYNASNSTSNVKKIYINSKSKPENISEEILEVVKNQGNHGLEFVDVYGKTYLLAINTYNSEGYKLNTSSFTYKEGEFGQKYILLSEVNNKIDKNTWWYVKEVEVKYKATNGDERTLSYNASFDNGLTTLTVPDGQNYDNITEVKLRTETASDRLDLADNIQYLIILTDIANNPYKLTISTTEGYYNYKYIDLPDNVYEHNDVLYTATNIKISYNIDFYTADVLLDSYNAEEGSHYAYEEKGKYAFITLLADVPKNPGDEGSCRDFDVQIKLIGEEGVTHNFDVIIDTASTLFRIENTNYEDKSSMIKSTFNNAEEYNPIDLRDGKYYKDLIAETVNISWAKSTSDYFIYTYDLYEFGNQNDPPKQLLKGGEESYPLAPNPDNTGKYVFMVTIKGKDGEWIASRVFGIAMSTTISGLYEVRDANDNLCDPATLTNLDEVIATFGESNLLGKYLTLGFEDENHMKSAISTFGKQTAVKMYIAKNKIIDVSDSNYAKALILHSNQDNGVNADSCELMTGTAIIRLYHVHRSNYRTFVVTMEVRETDSSTSILSQLLFMTGSEQADQHNLLSSGASKTIYDAEAEYYKLKFSPYNKNHYNTNPLEQHNRIIIDIYYNNDENSSRRIVGNASDELSEINFKNSGSYTFKIQDYAGNIQYFKTSTSTLDRFTIVLMKKNDILYTVKVGDDDTSAGSAPIQYAYYDQPVTLQINGYNEITGLNNYIPSSININVNLNGIPNYKGYEHPTDSLRYIFKDYGTYVVNITADLLSTGEEVSTQLIFTILNPNEARNALDFTSIYGYEIVSVFSVLKNTEIDVTSKFVGMLQDKANVGGVDVYNKLVTYDRLVETFGTATQGKMKFKMLYRVNDDPLLPTREVEFSFTLNNEKPTITTSIKPGEKTTKPVVLKFNAENVYAQVGECILVVNGQEIMRIDHTTTGLVEKEITDVGEYYVQLVGDSGNVLTSFNFTIKEPLNTVAIILIVIIVLIVVGLIGTVIWLRTRMKVR